MRPPALLTLLPFVLAGAACATQTVLQADGAGSSSSGSPTTSQPGSKPVLTDELKNFVQHVVDKYNVQGLTLGVIHDGEVEFGAWGRKTEDDDPMTTDASISCVPETATPFLHACTTRRCFTSPRARKRSYRPPSGY